MRKYVAIKKAYDDDAYDDEEESFLINFFSDRREAAEWLADQYEYHEGYSGCDNNKTWDKENPQRKMIVEFLLDSKNGEALFHWTWKRRGSHRNYRIMEYQENEAVMWHTKPKKLFKYKQSCIKPR